MVDVNYLAVLACGVVAMILGFLWYGPLFGKKWSQLMGWGEMTPELMAEKQKGARKGYAISFVTADSRDMRWRKLMQIRDLHKFHKEEIPEGYREIV